MCMRWRIAPLLTAASLISACERVVPVAVRGDVPRLVIDARLESRADSIDRPQRVILTTTADYFASAAPPPARGARVVLVHPDGDSSVFTESRATAGVFEAPRLTLVTGAVYRLRVTWQGDTYEASDRLPAPVPIGPLTFRPPLTPFRPGSGLRATVRIADPPGAGNCYLWEQWIDGRPTRSGDTDAAVRPIVDDDLIDGFVAEEFQPYGGIEVRPGQLVRIRQHAISRETFRYFSALNEQGANDGSPLGVPSASLRGNIANLSRPAVLALGYFAVTAVTEVEARVP
jgi:hypothetical protein